MARVHPSLREIEASLKRLGSSVRADQEKRYLKSDLTFLGVSMPNLRREAKLYRKQHGPFERAELLDLAQALWESRVHELRSFAIALLELEETLLGSRDLAALIAFVRDAKTWAHVDWLATKVLGPIIEREPRAKRQLDRWARDADFWVRRSALLCFHDELLAGRGDFEHFAKLATPMLGETELFIRKAIGWVLRSTSRRTPERTYAYVSKHAAAMSALTFKEATRNLTQRQIAQLSALRLRAPARLKKPR